MPPSKPTIGILTGGGDCPGLNAVIRAAVKSALRLGYDCVGFLKGYEGLVDPVACATDAPDPLHTTAASHERLMVLEVMGRHADGVDSSPVA